MEFFMRQSTAFNCLTLFGAITIAHGLLARILISKFFFDYPIVLLLLSMALTFLLIELGRLINLLRIPAYTFNRGKEMFLPSLFYSLSQFIALNCLDGIKLPFFPFLEKFFALLIIPFYSYFLRRQRPSKQTILVIICICLGSGLSSVYEVSYDYWIWTYSLIAITMFSASLVMMERLHEQQSISALELIYLNSFNCTCFFLISDFVQDEFLDAYMFFQQSATFSFYFCFLSFIVIVALGNAAILYCITAANALNIAIVQNCASALQVLIAYIFSIQVFYDSIPDYSTFVGICAALAATVFYFVSPKDAELKPDFSWIENGGGAKYHIIDN